MRFSAVFLRLAHAACFPAAPVSRSPKTYDARRKGCADPQGTGSRGSALVAHAIHAAGVRPSVVRTVEASSRGVRINIRVFFSFSKFCNLYLFLIGPWV